MDATRPKPKRNAFFYFVMEKTRQMKANGTTKEDLIFQNVVDMVSPVWNQMTSKEREPYKEKALADRGEASEEDGTVAGTNCMGMSMSEAEKEELTKMNQDSLKREALKRLVRNHMDRLVEMPIILCNFEAYCRNMNSIEGVVLPSEIALCAFNMKDGIYDNFATLIDPGVMVKQARICEVEFQSKRMDLLMPNYSVEFQDYEGICNSMYRFLTQNGALFAGEYNVFCLDTDIEFTEACLEWLARGTSDPVRVNVFSLNSLIPIISIKAHSLHASEKSDAAKKEMADAWQLKENLVGNRVVYPTICPLIKSDGLFIKPEHVDIFLGMKNYAAYQEMGCRYHVLMHPEIESTDVSFCPLSIINRRAYSLLDAMLKNFDVIPQLGRHYPRFDNMNKERKRRRDMIQNWSNANWKHYVDEYVCLWEERHGGVKEPREGLLSSHQ